LINVVKKTVLVADVVLDASLGPGPQRPAAARWRAVWTAQVE